MLVKAARFEPRSNPNGSTGPAHNTIERVPAVIEQNAAAGVSNIFLTWAAEERAHTIEIDGDQGEIRVVGDSVVLKSNAQEQRWSCPPSLSEGSHHPDWFGGVAADFVTAAAGGSRGNLDEAILCARLIDAARQSSAAGGVRLSLDG